MDIPDVTRVVVIGGQVEEFWGDEWYAELQDDGRTLKLFQIGEGHLAKHIRDKALASQFMTTFKRRKADQ